MKTILSNKLVLTGIGILALVALFFGFNTAGENTTETGANVLTSAIKTSETIEGTTTTSGTDATTNNSSTTATNNETEVDTTSNTTSK